MKVEKISLREFAELSGVVIKRCEPEWGGTFAYSTDQFPNSTTCGYRTEKSALRGWMRHTFGEKQTKALKKFLTDM